jgi:sensor histidine kinase regulating citrate/malate metabolism
VWLFSLDIFQEGRFDRERQILELMFKEKIKQYEQNEQSIEMINMKYHDLKRTMLRLQQTEDQEGREKLYAELNRAINAYDFVVQTGNESLDVVLSDKALLCEKNHIKLSFLIDGALLSFMDTLDIYALFDNALDNAIESVMQIAEEERRLISVQVIRYGDTVFIHCENRCEEEPVFERGLPRTSKKKDVQNHGFGVKSIRHVVEKYDGELNFSFKNQIFSLDIMFNIKKT